MHVSMHRRERILVRVAPPTDRHINQQGKPLKKPTRLRTTMLLALIPLLLASSLSAQPPNGTAKLGQEIRKLDRAEAAAVLVTDVPAIEMLWADDFTVNAPNNKVLRGKPDAIKLVRDGILDYSSFKRDVEAVLIHGDTVILMRLETVKAKGKAPFAGQTVRRRFTNIWMKREGQWQLTARQATIIGRE
jgi:ketosteroid isomerase-like protein